MSAASRKQHGGAELASVFSEPHQGCRWHGQLFLLLVECEDSRSVEAKVSSAGVFEYAIAEAVSVVDGRHGPVAEALRHADAARTSKPPLPGHQAKVEAVNGKPPFVFTACAPRAC